MWYVIQTISGKEEELIFQMHTILKQETYRSAFVINAEWQKRLGGEWQIQVKPLFPGYVFIETEQPEAVFLELKNVPRFSRLLGNGRFEFTAVEEAEKSFLEKLCQTSEETEKKQKKTPSEKEIRPGWLVPLSTIETGEDGQPAKIEGPLQYFEEQIIRVNLHKRYAVARLTLCHREQTVLFGIKLKRELPESADRE